MSWARWKLRVFGLICSVHFCIAVFSSVQVTSCLTVMNVAMKVLRGLLNSSHFLLALVNSSSMLILVFPLYIECVFWDI